MDAVTTSLDFKQLPLRASLACVVRCARRAQHSAKAAEDSVDLAGYRKAIEFALIQGEGFSNGAEVDFSGLAPAEEAIVNALTTAKESRSAELAEAYAAIAAYAVIDALRSAHTSSQGEDPVPSAERAVSAAMTAIDAAQMSDPTAIEAVRHDCQILQEMQLGSFPELGERIDSTAAGPLGLLFRADEAAGPDSTQSLEEISASDDGQLSDEQPRDSDIEGKLEMLAALIRTQQQELTAERQVLETDRAAADAERKNITEEREHLSERASAIAADQEKLQESTD